MVSPIFWFCQLCLILQIGSAKEERVHAPAAKAESPSQSCLVLSSQGGCAVCIGTADNQVNKDKGARKFAVYFWALATSLPHHCM